jgi:uncharacterized protein (UPF0548 family)
MVAGVWHFRRPGAARVSRYLDAQRGLPVTYPAVGATNGGEAPAGFVLDHNRQRLGRGEAVFARACEDIRRWRMFPAPWTVIEPAEAKITQDQVVAVHIRVLGLWWMNAARIVYVIDEPTRFGFAYGTLPGHAESGEERFLVEQRGDGVYYDLYAFSRPRHWAARLGAPVTRALQKRFARDSKAAMAQSLRS